MGLNLVGKSFSAVVVVVVVCLFVCFFLSFHAYCTSPERNSVV